MLQPPRAALETLRLVVVNLLVGVAVDSARATSKDTGLQLHLSLYLTWHLCEHPILQNAESRVITLLRLFTYKMPE